MVWGTIMKSQAYDKKVPQEWPFDRKGGGGSKAIWACPHRRVPLQKGAPWLRDPHLLCSIFFPFLLLDDLKDGQRGLCCIATSLNHCFWDWDMRYHLRRGVLMLNKFEIPSEDMWMITHQETRKNMINLISRINQQDMTNLDSLHVHIAV